MAATQAEADKDALRRRTHRSVNNEETEWTAGEEYKMSSRDVSQEDIKSQTFIRHLIPEAILGYIWWSTFFSLAATIWFFPLNLLAISGYEAFALLALSPIFTCIPFVDRIVTSKQGLTTLQILTVLGTLSFHAPTAIFKLIITSTANFTAMLWLAGALWFKHNKYRKLSFWGLAIGFFIRLIIRMAFQSLNPLWTSSSYNIAIFIIALACAVDRAVFINSLSMETSDESVSKPSYTQPWSTWMPVALGAGAWLFIAQWLFGEVSVISRYTGDSQPSWSVPPVPGGICTFISLLFGIKISNRKFVTSSAWWLFAGLSAVTFYKAPSVVGFIGGQGIAIYTMSVFPRVTNQVSKCNKGKCLTLAVLTCIIFLLASVWVVAYNFVPGGVFTRERNDMVLAVAIVLIGLAVAIDVNESKTDDDESTRSFFADDRAKDQCVFKKGVLPGEYATSGDDDGEKWRRGNSVMFEALAIKDPKSFTSVIWTIHFGYDNHGWHSFKRATQVLKDTNADVIAILESDCSRPYTGSTDLVSYIEEHLGFYADYGPKTKDHTWGAAILSRYPIIKTTHYLLPSPEGELAPALLASVNISGRIVDFVTVHMGNDGDDLDRQLQAEKLATVTDASPNPLVFLGYVTSAPGSRDYLKLLEAGRLKDIDYEDYWRWCEYIMYRDLIRKGYARISHGVLSDTELQLGRFQIPDNIDNHDDNHGLVTTSEDVPENERFSAKFGDFHIGDYHGNGHHYHRSTPKYFVPTE
eukprot:gene7604-8444_t